MLNDFMSSERLYFRPLEPEDAPMIARCKNSPFVRETFFFNLPENIAQQRDYLKDLYKPDRRLDYTPFAITLKENDIAIGVTAFHRIDLVSRAAVYSIIISDESEWGKGYAGEVTRQMIKYGFEILNLNRIQLVVSAENVRAAHVYEKCGFVREGVMRQAMYHHNRYSDFIMMSILRAEYYAKLKDASDTSINT